MDKIHCNFNIKMRCYDQRRCPLQDPDFSHLLDMWVFTGREPPSLNWERGGPVNTQAAEKNALRKSEVARLFDFPERVQWFVAHGSMTKWLCEDIRRGYFLWNETQDGIPLRKAKRRYEDKKRA